MSLDVSTADDHAVIAVEGELDAYTSHQLRACLAELDGEGVTHIAVDLSGLTFVDSSGLGVLMSAGRRARDQGGELVLREVSPQIRRVLDVTGLSDLLPGNGSH